MKKVFAAIGLTMLLLSAFSQLPAGIPLGVHKVKLPIPSADSSQCAGGLKYTFTAKRPETFYVSVNDVYVEGHGSPGGGSYSYTLCPNADGTYPKLTVYEK